MQRLVKNLKKLPARTARTVADRLDPHRRLGWTADRLRRRIEHRDVLDWRLMELASETPEPPGRLDAKVSILGWYGNETVGDQAILGGILRRLDPAQVTQTTSDRAVSEATLSALGAEAVTLIDDSPQAAVQAACEADLVLIGGGPIKEGEIVDGWADALRAAVRAGAATMVFGCGVGPVRTPAAAARIRRLFAACHGVTLRDEGSVRLAARLGADTAATHVAADSALALPLPDLPAHDAAGPVGLSLRGLARDYHLPGGRSIAQIEADVAEAYIALIRHIHDVIGRDVVLVPTQMDGPGNDPEVLGRLRNRVADKARVHLLDHREPVGLVRELAGLSMLVGMRFHSVLLGWLAGLPVLGIDYDMHGGKVTAAMHQMGCPEHLLPIAEVSGPVLIERFDAVWKQRQSVRQVAAEQLIATQQREWRSAEAMRRIVDHVRR
jgi:polysaccharide pyruvyl transferase WcaK-like protein